MPTARAPTAVDFRNRRRGWEDGLPEVDWDTGNSRIDPPISDDWRSVSGIMLNRLIFRKLLIRMHRIRLTDVTERGAVAEEPTATSTRPAASSG
ncbi:hypothetical protein Kisp01_59270 [Kineosporia sp. NBRC 101677]|nr:hypothetical protein Kisp01_59270 [Kineosporia sp. NBRC 101677]